VRQSCIFLCTAPILYMRLCSNLKVDCCSNVIQRGSKKVERAGRATRAVTRHVPKRMWLLAEHHVLFPAWRSMATANYTQR
jgi:hypothetical protein